MNHFIENYSSFHVTRALIGRNGVPYQKTEHELMTVKKRFSLHRSQLWPTMPELIPVSVA